MSEGSQGFSFTGEDRVLLHLLDHVGMREEVVRPAELTQEGISLGVSLERKHLPRTLKRMIEKGLVSEQRGHVKGKRQRMKTYTLTYTGEERAVRLRRHLCEMTVTVRMGPITEEHTVGELPELLGGNATLAKVLSHITREGLLDPDDIMSSEKRKEIVKRGDRLAIYEAAMSQGWKDGMLTKDEKDILLKLKEMLGITEKEHRMVEERVLQSVDKRAHGPAVEVYRVAMEQAQADGVITEDEKAILEEIRKRFNIEEGGE